MRLLLHHVRGPISFEHLKTVVVRDEDGDILEIKPCSTYTEACQVLGLVEDDSHWYQAMEEAAVSQSPAQLRNLFAILIAVCGLNKPITMWENHKEDMTEDFLHQARRNNPTENIEHCDALFNNTLLILEVKILSITGNKLALYGLPEPVHDQPELTSKDVLRETSYDVQALRAYMAENVPRLTPDQQQAFIAITGMIGNERGGMVFLDAPGGTGKTFLLNLLLAFVRKEKDMAVAVASSGIAATLLAGGRTAHSAFKLPLDLARSDSATCNISKGTGQGHVLTTCKLIVWDEATMSHRNAFHALDKTLQDLRGSSAIMGGATVVLAGDFRQTLPIVTRGTPADQINACLKNSYLWQHVEKFSLTTNMRSHIQGLIIVPCGQIVNSPDELLSKVYPKIQQNFKDQDWLSHRAILASRNDVVEKINVTIQKQLPGQEYAYKSIDCILNDDEAVQYPIEFLNSIQTPDLQAHNLILKVGAPIILIRNIDAPRLCNGTRLIVKKLMQHVIQATVLTGCAKGEDVFIPRIPIIPSDNTIQFKRIQFPLKLCFAMTINKSQGQSLEIAGIDLQTPCFSHGQLYVACSRVGKEENLFVHTPNGTAKNVVYHIALK
ncbi:ATP-dependent DNA helicase PIF1 [Trichonephila clavipes]|nr:ATP-dependent DNA helicase PIF1 [Trichonephila clavipes]